MAIVVVGGHSQNVGKTSVVEGLITAFNQYSWTAVKISSHRHVQHSNLNQEAIREETDSAGRGDTSRFLAAGAARSLWVRMDDRNADSVMQRLLPIIKSSPNTVIESNRILKYIRPDLYLFVLRYDIEDFKESARETIGQSSAMVAVNSSIASPEWKGFSRETLGRIPLFTVEEPHRIPQALFEFIQSRLPSIPCRP